MKYLCIALAALTLGGCAGLRHPAAPTEMQVKVVKIGVRAPCPDKTTYDKLKGSRPKRLRDQPMPASAEERGAKTQAQLGRYEADGGWADRAEAALDRCQQAETLDPVPDSR